MVILTSLPLEQPRVSLNQLGEFPFATPAEKVAILTDLKFGNNYRSPYYHSAYCTILRAFHNGRFDHPSIAAEIERLRVISPRNSNHAAKLANNMEMMQRFLELKAPAVPVTGQYSVIRRNALLELGGVVISVRPEFLTRHPDTGFFSLTKLRFSKSKVSADSSEVILLVLLKFGQRLNLPSLQLDPEETRLVDCHARSIIPSHTLPRLREQQLQEALREVHRLWPTLRRPDDRAAPDHSRN